MTAWRAALARAACALAACVPANALRAQAADPASGFAVLRAGDTLATERFTRTASSVEGALVPRGGQPVSYRLALAAGGLVSRMELRTGADTGALPVVLTLSGDSSLFDSGAAPARKRAMPAGALPYLNLSAASLEQVVLRARALGGDSAVVPLLVPGSAAAFPAVVREAAGRTPRVDLASVSLRLFMDAGGRLEGGCVPSQGVGFVRTSPAPSLSLSCGATAGPAPDYSAPAGAPYAAREVHVPTPRGYALAGTLTLPSAARGPVPAVVLVSGSGPEDRDSGTPEVPGYRPFRQVADTLGRRGIAVLRLDDRGVGASGGDPSSATTADLADDVRAAVAYLRTRPEVDPRRLAVAGHSEGAAIATMVAAGDSDVRAVALLAGQAWAGRRLNRSQNREALARSGLSGARLDSALAALGPRVDSLAARLPWFRYYLEYDPLPAARALRVPVLVLHGGRDRQVGPEQARELAAAIRAGGNGDVTVRVFPGLDHLFLRDPEGTPDPAHYAALPSRDVPQEVLGALADWLAAKLR
ncbi:MAG: hypothetical protein JWM27_4112 [Gemmatimonadetes bacterium]|nr:hypothetical protein [Gemmatimonadota bacterium]